MASDGQPVKIPVVSLVHGSQAPTVSGQRSGKSLPVNGNTSPAPKVSLPRVPEPAKSELHAQVALLNKFLNDSGRPAQFRPSSDEKVIEEVNPANGEVIAEYPATEFAALARSVGISGAVVNRRV